MGPIATKMMEMHALYNGVKKIGKLSDDIVDNVRNCYAIDVYDEFIRSAD